MFKTLAGYLGDMLSGSIKDERIQLSREQSEDLRLKLDNLVAEANRLRSENESLVAENSQLAFSVKNLQSELKALREELADDGLVAHMGVLWKRTDTGFETYPYCSQCRDHPIMSSVGGFFVCGAGLHHAPDGVTPPTN